MDTLCVNCQHVGHSIAQCPAPLGKSIQGKTGAQDDQSVSEEYLQSLANPRDELCQRCAEIDIINWLNEDVEDEMAPDGEATNRRGLENRQANMKLWRDLGPLKSLALRTSCPLCRMIYRVFPVPAEDESLEASYFLRPVRAYNRHGQSLPPGPQAEELGRTAALYVSVESRHGSVAGVAHFFGDPKALLVSQSEKTFGLSNRNPAPNHPACSVRYRGSLCDLDLLRTWLRVCETEHGELCHVEWSEKLLICKVIDVEERKVVPCPQDCRYTALSYVWGAVEVKTGALEGRYLPQTIEDAITVTKRLGVRYLWVDALCIDQRPSPEKMEQLRMMDLIYSCAVFILAAVDGGDGDWGLPGVSTKRAHRERQGREVVAGAELLSTLPSLAHEIPNTKWNTRAWTMQENLLGNRKLYFSRSQVMWFCNSGVSYESMDDATNMNKFMHIPDNAYDVDPKRLRKLYNEHPELRRKYADEQFTRLVDMYTPRQMTNDSDSLNACLGILSLLERAVLPTGFVYGLPLKEFPQSLRWIHTNKSVSHESLMARRRPNHPSWSFVGWEGMAVYTNPLILTQGEYHDESVDAVVSYCDIDGQCLLLDGFRFKLEVRKQPFDDAYIPGTDVYLGQLQEGVASHKMTLPPGVFDFLLIERFRFRYGPDRPIRHTLYLLMLEAQDNGSFRRKTMVRLYVEPGTESQTEYIDLTRTREKVNLT
ncbi:uncharacterized protein JN550_010203 [Neoarthrinium moseri]|uniref:uncharacterized protein n=1 Tax=Neoarthrinium moseri TaxID=1658444 RepID=UPI001FDE6550|nr:uncharacterized protein JN550_010203 [Neoarthrinium moseri]KAI1862341.1 hypothetical protein JN550_010203 [Neoarthrinium moseri]